MVVSSPTAHTPTETDDEPPIPPSTFSRGPLPSVDTLGPLSTLSTYTSTSSQTQSKSAAGRAHDDFHAGSIGLERGGGEGYFGEVMPLTSVAAADVDTDTDMGRAAIGRPLMFDGLKTEGVLAGANASGGKPFSMIGAICLATCCINSWIVMLIGLDAGLRYGGPSALVWGFLYSSICTYCTVASHAELFAVYPTAAGQYHWVYAVAPERIRTALSWLTGMVNVVGLWLGNAAAAYLCSNLLVSIILLHRPDYNLQPSAHYGIFACIVILASFSTMCIGNRANRLIERGLMCLTIVGALAIVITLLTMQSPKASASFVFAGTANQTGYSSLAIAWLIGLLQSQYSFCGFDIVYHISEEIPNAKLAGPRAAKATIVVSSVLAWVVVVCVVFCVDDVEQVLNSPYRLAITQIIHNATRSTAASTTLILLILVIFLNTVRGIAMTATRVLFAFGRDGMLPYGHVFGYTCFGEPVVGTVLTVLVSLTVGLVQLGPGAAFYSLLGSSTILTFTCYGVPCAVMFFGGRARLDAAFPDRLHNLGRWGLLYNAIAIVFMVQAMVVYCFPNELPVSPQNMNYVIVYLAGFALILGGVWYGFARRRWPGPDVDFLEKISKSSTTATGSSRDK